MFAYTCAEELGGLFHVGTLDIANKSNQSHEWNGLSVSNCPHAWRQICGCTGTTWELIPKGQDRFLLFHDLDDDDLAQIRTWAIEEGYFDADVEYRVYWYDNEYEEERYFTFSGDEYDNAIFEYEAKLEEEYDGVRFEERSNGLAPTDHLLLVSLVKIDPSMSLDIAVMLYAEEELETDGVWWDDNYDPYALSAPRGVIFNTRLDNFEAVETD